MHIIILLILLLPVFAICKIIANKLGISTFLVISYVLTWLFCLFLYSVNWTINSLWTVFLAPFISHIAIVLTIDIIKKSFLIIDDFLQEKK